MNSYISTFKKLFSYKLNASYAIVSILIFLFVFSITYLSLFFYQIGPYNGVDFWLPGTLEYKLHISNKTESPKIIIISGSNALFGLNSNTLKNITGLPTLNLATHAGSDISFYYYLLKNELKKGDLVVAPFEFSEYQKKGPTNWFLNHMLVANTDYIHSLNLLEKMSFLKNTDPKRIFKGVFNKFRERTYPFSNLQSVLSFFEKKYTGESVWNGYSIKSLDKTGAINVKEARTYINKERYFHTDKFSLSPHFIKYFKKIESLVQEREAQLFVTYPVTVRAPFFDMRDEKTKRKINLFKKNLQLHDVKLICRMNDFNLHPKLFFDTIYHLNYWGGKLRSKRLAKCIKTVLDKNNLKNESSTSDIDLIHEEKKYLNDKRNYFLKK